MFMKTSQKWAKNLVTHITSKQVSAVKDDSHVAVRRISLSGSQSHLWNSWWNIKDCLPETSFPVNIFLQTQSTAAQAEFGPVAIDRTKWVASSVNCHKSILYIYIYLIYYLDIDHTSNPFIQLGTSEQLISQQKKEHPWPPSYGFLSNAHRDNFPRNCRNAEDSAAPRKDQRCEAWALMSSTHRKGTRKVAYDYNTNHRFKNNETWNIPWNHNITNN